MKKITMFLLATALSTSFAGTKLKDFSEAKEVLSQGELFTFVVNVDQCEFKTPHKDLVGSQGQVVYKPNFLIYGPSYEIIKSRGESFAQDFKSIPNLKNVHVTYTYELNKDNVLNINYQFLDPKSFKAKRPALKISCKLGKGFDLFA